MPQEPLLQTAVQASTVVVKLRGASAAVWWGIFSFNEWMVVLGLAVAIIGALEQA